MKVSVKGKKELLKTNFMHVAEYTLEQDVNGEKHEYTRQCMYRGNAVFIIPYDKEKQSVVMVKQSRIGAIIDGAEHYTLEFPAGIIDDGEEPIETAKRELLEETGLDAANIEQIYNAPIYTTVGGSNEKITYFFAEVDSDKVIKNGGETGEHEFIETEVIPVAELFDMAFKKQIIDNAATLISTLLLEKELA